METPDILVGPGTQFAQGEKSLYPGQCHDIEGSVSRELRGVKSVTGFPLRMCRQGPFLIVI